MQLEPTNVTTLLKTYATRNSFRELANTVGIDRFEEMYLPFTERLAMRLSEIPLQRSAFARKGGALVCALRSGMLAVKLCDKTIFEPTATAARRMASDGQYRWMAYCSALATVYLIATNAVQINFESGEVYSFASRESLVERAEVYQVNWASRTTPTIQATYLYLLDLFVPGQFEELGAEMVASVAQAINPSLSAVSGESPLAKVVRMAIERTVDDDKEESEKAINESPLTGFERKDQNPAQGSEPSVALHVSDTSSVDAGATTSCASEAVSPVRSKATQWLRGLAAMKSLNDEVSLKGDGHLRVTRKALSFGAAASDNYRMLHEAQFVHEKVEGGVLLVREAAELYSRFSTDGAQA